MRVYLITPTCVDVYDREPAPGPGDGLVVRQVEDLAPLTVAELTGLWNRLPGVALIRKFRNRQEALDKIWARFGALPITSLPPAGPTKPTKNAVLQNLLRRPEGATLAELVTATGWQPHAVRGALSGALKKKLGLTVIGQAEAGRGRVYRIGTGA